MAMIRVGISARVVAGDPHARGSRRKDLLGAEHALLTALVDAGALPLVLAWPRSTWAPAPLAAAAAATIDALVLQGGSDIGPQRYGQMPLRAEWAGCAERDDFELALLREVLDAGKPVLGICRGCQLINVYFGGSLQQDLNLQRPGSVQHSQPALYENHVHGVRLAGDGFLAALYGRADAQVNSAHHQGIDRLGTGLEAAAWCAEDGLVEAFAAREGWVRGVQWHPEFQPAASSLLPGAALFAALVDAAASAVQTRNAAGGV